MSSGDTRTSEMASMSMHASQQQNQSLDLDTTYCLTKLDEVAKAIEKNMSIIDDIADHELAGTSENLKECVEKADDIVEEVNNDQSVNVDGLFCDSKVRSTSVTI